MSILTTGNGSSRFEFASARRIIFGPGTAGEVPLLAREMGERALLVIGSSPSRAAVFTDSLHRSGIETIAFSVAGEPTLDLVSRGRVLAQEQACDLVISCGGGSVIDTGKAIAALVPNAGGLLDYLEVIGQAKHLEKPPLAFIAIPTTAGTGSEVTRNAVLGSSEHRMKVSLRSPLMLPRLTVIDPNLTLDLPPAVSATTGLDALTQLIEAYVSSRATPLTDALCVDGIRRAARSLERVCNNGHDLEARSDMALASLYSGMALANAGLGAVHGFAGPIGGMFSAPHGAICAALLPHVMRINMRALQQRKDARRLERFAGVARLLAGNSADAHEGMEWLQAVCARLGIRPLSALGVRKEDIPELVKKAATASSMKANPVVLPTEDLTEILECAL